MIFGTEGDDLLEGMPGADDVIYGYGGNDTLVGGDGADHLDGGAGADEIDGGEDEGLPPPSRSTRTSIWGDTATYVHSDAGVTIDLAMGTAQGGDAEGDTLTGIESVRGSDHADMLVARNDDPATEERPPEGSTLYGQRGDDTLSGGTGEDRLWGGKGDDVLMGGAAFDILEGGFGADVIDGGDGFDFAAYELSDAGVTIDLSTGTAAGGHAEGDTLTGIEFVFGSSHADRLTGNAGLNILHGGAGADMLDGGAGDADLADYWSSDAGVTVNLATGTGQGGHAEGDTLTGFDRVRGSRHADRLIGDAEDNLSFGRDGNDTLEGGAGDDYLRGGPGADVLDGGTGDGDAADYFDSDTGVTVNFATGTGHGGDAEGDTFIGIERVYASNHADLLTGDAEDNRLSGRGGDDTLEGGAGDDRLSGDMGADVLDGGEGHDTVDYWGSDTGVTVNLATGTGQGGEAEGDTLKGIEEVWAFDHADHLTGDAGDNRLNGRGGDDTLEGGAGDDRLSGDMGADVLDGGEGHDTVDYWGSDTGVTVNLATGTGQGGEAEGDTLKGIEEVWAFDHADHLTGDAGDNRLSGRGGDDTLEGGAGNDNLQGDDGDDNLHGGAGADRLNGGDGHDDWALYGGSDAGVTVNLATGTGQGGHAEGDTLTGIEKIHGSEHADHLTGDDGDNGLNGDGGNDTLEGGAGDDWLDGQDGEDLLTGGEGADTFVFGDGDTVTDFEDGSDLINIHDMGHISADNFETNVTIRQSGDDVQVQIGDAVLTLTGLSAADVTADDFALA